LGIYTNEKNAIEIADAIAALGFIREIIKKGRKATVKSDSRIERLWNVRSQGQNRKSLARQRSCSAFEPICDIRLVRFMGVGK
jgi:hypothetical protein